MEWMFLPFKRYAEFSGRSRRKEYWMFILFNSIVIMVLVSVMLFSLVGSGGGEDFEPGLLMIVPLALYSLATFIPNLAVQVRRFHDQDKSGWLVLLNLIPYLGSLIVLIFMLLDGTSGPNQYGPDPKGRGTA